MSNSTLVLAVVIAALCLTGIVAEIGSYLYLKFDVPGGFYEMPRTLVELKKDSRWELMVKDEELNVEFWSFKDDPRVSLGFDSFGNIAGVRVCYVKEDLPKRAEKHNKTYPYRFDDKPMFSDATYLGRDVWYNTVLFSDPALLKSGGRSSLADSVGENVWLKLNGQWTLIPKDECQAESLGFNEQGCFIGMGRHYFYNTTKDLDCADFQGIFLLYEFGEMIGLGLIPFAAFASGNDRTWFEDPPLLVVNEIVTHGPECLPKWVSDYGASSLHLFFKEHPRTTLCTWPNQKSDQCKKN